MLGKMRSRKLLPLAVRHYLERAPETPPFFRLTDTAGHSRLALRKATGIFLPMNRPNKVEALPEYRLRLTYPDGVQGIIDLAGDVGRGVFTPLADEAFFRTVHIGQFGQIAWSEDLEICPDAAYHEIADAAATEPAHARG
jgi:hypothetical protein